MYLYCRMAIVMLVTLYTSRVILQSLGVEDFGIYNLVFGVVAIFRVINGALTDASQRFITFELGKSSNENISAVFSQTIILHIIIAIVIIVFAETIGLWFLYNKLIIPNERLHAAFWVYQFSLISLFILIVSVPYNALIIAHERMKAFALISIVDVAARLIAAYMLFINGSYDKLILYGFLMLVSQIIQRVLFTRYCHREFPNTKFQLNWNKEKIKELGKFASWTIFGNLSYIGTTQGTSILLGMFFNPVVNAARGIAVVVQGAIDSFVRSFQTAVNPQITKSYAAGDIKETTRLVHASSYYSFFLMLFPLIPIFWEADTIMHLWLTDVPEFTISFVRCTLILSLISTLFNPLEVAIKATGDIKRFEIIVYSTKLLTLPLAYLTLSIGCSPTIVFFGQILMDIFAWYLASHILNKKIKTPQRLYYISILVRIIPVLLLTFLMPYGFIHYLPSGIPRLCCLTIASILWTSIVILLFGISSMERKQLVAQVKKIL